jgi:hypothetical protein
MARRKKKNKNTASDRTPTVIRQDKVTMSVSDSAAIFFSAFLVTLMIFLISYAIYVRFK